MCFPICSPFADILGTNGEEPPAFYGDLTGMQLPFAKQKAPAIVAQLEVTLAEVYNGAHKIVAYTRKKLTDEGVTVDEAVESQIAVKPGAEEGVISVLEGMGDQGVHYLPGDVEIELVLLPDELWSRDGNDLFYKHELTLAEALCGKIVAVPHGNPVPDGAVPMPAGMRMPAKKVAEATRRARLSGRSVSIDVPPEALPSLANTPAASSGSVSASARCGHLVSHAARSTCRVWAARSCHRRPSARRSLSPRPIATPRQAR